MSVEGQEAMQQVVQDAMAGMSAQGKRAGRESLEGAGGAGAGAEGGVMMEGGGAGDADGGDLLLERSLSREQREEEWALRLAEAEDSVVRRRGYIYIYIYVTALLFAFVVNSYSVSSRYHSVW